MRRPFKPLHSFKYAVVRCLIDEDDGREMMRLQSKHHTLLLAKKACKEGDKIFKIEWNPLALFKEEQEIWGVTEVRRTEE